MAERGLPLRPRLAAVIEATYGYPVFSIKSYIIIINIKWSVS